MVGRCLTMGGRRLALTTTAEVLSSINNPRLKAILAAQWPDMGTPPNSSAFVFQAMVAAHYADGAFYPVGGASGIGQAAVELLRQSGGDCMVNHAVEEILVENGRAIGVRARNKSQACEFYAPVIVSDAGARTTFLQLVPEHSCAAERARARRLTAGPSANVLFLGLNANPKTAGFDEANIGCSAIYDMSIRRLRTSTPMSRRNWISMAYSCHSVPCGTQLKPTTRLR